MHHAEENQDKSNSVPLNKHQMQSLILIISIESRRTYINHQLSKVDELSLVQQIYYTSSNNIFIFIKTREVLYNLNNQITK